MQATKPIYWKRALAAILVGVGVSCARAPDIVVTDDEAFLIVNTISHSYDCTISPERLVWSKFSHDPQPKNPIVTNTFFVWVDGQECDEATEALQRLGEEKGIDFRRIFSFPFEMQNTKE